MLSEPLSSKSTSSYNLMQKYSGRKMADAARANSTFTTRQEDTSDISRKDDFPVQQGTKTANGELAARGILQG